MNKISIGGNVDMGYESRPKRFARIVEDLQTNVGLLSELKDEYEQW